MKATPGILGVAFLLKTLPYPVTRSRLGRNRDPEMEVIKNLTLFL